ncbi:unnamed protein product [Schistosoma turkestanicum]|nr:unnamed protein product [Schistosoma turkestanicum]
MNRTNSPFDEAYVTYSGLDLTLKDQSVLGSRVQASSTPRRLNYIPTRNLYGQNEYYCSEQFNTENNSIFTSEHPNQVQNIKESVDNSKQTDLKLGFNYISGLCNSKNSIISCYHSVQSNNLDCSEETEDLDKLSPLDLRIKSFSDDVCLNSNIDNKSLIFTTDTKVECEIFTNTLLSDEMIHRNKRSYTSKQPGNSFNIQSLLEVTDQFKAFPETVNTTDSNTFGSNMKSNFTNMKIIDQANSSNFSFDQFLMDHLQTMNPLLLNSQRTHIKSSITPSQLIDITQPIQSTAPVSTTLSLNNSNTIKFPVKQQTGKPNPITPMYSITNNLTYEQLSVKKAKHSPVYDNVKQTECMKQSMKNTYDLHGSSLSSDDLIAKQRGKTCDVGKMPIIFYYPEPSDSKIKVKAMLERNDPCLKYVNDGAAIRNPFAIDRKTQLMHLTSLLCVKLDNSTYLCKGCNRTTRRLRPMQQHLLSHSASKFNLCVKCLKGFNDKYDMKRHTRKHTLVRPYVCPECGRSFSQRCSLEGHRRKIHRIQLNYSPNQRREIVRVCETCGYSCPKLYDMLQHTLNNHPNSNCLPRLRRQLIRYKEKFQNILSVSDDNNQASNMKNSLEENCSRSCISPCSTQP